MADTAQPTLIGGWLGRERVERLADCLAVAVAVSLPWSTTASGILIALWLIALVPTLDLAALRRGFAIPAGAWPAALCLLAVAGMAWTDVAFAERFGAVKVFLRLVCIALLFVQFQRSERGMWVLGGFLASCTALLVVSWTHWVVHPQSWRVTTPGVPFKDYVIQSGEFLLCAFALGHLTLDAWRTHRRRLALALGALACLFLANIVYVATGRSTLVIFGVLVVVFAFQRFGWKGALGMVLVAAALSAAAWTSSSHLRSRVLNIVHEVYEYQDRKAATSSGIRLEFWRKSIAIVSSAPIIGHGTGSLRDQFQRLAVGTEGVSSFVTDNPHNQTLVVAIQLGLIGAAVLLAMWISHLLLFRGSSLVAMLGMAVVAQNIVAGLFNTYLFEFTLGWMYVFGVGVLGGMVLRGASMGAQPSRT